MKMFAGVKSVDDIAKNAGRYGYLLDRREFDGGKGVIELVNKQRTVRVLTKNGKFAVMVNGARIADERYFWLESEKWYSDLLELLYEPLNEEVTT